MIIRLEWNGLQQFVQFGRNFAQNTNVCLVYVRKRASNPLVFIPGLRPGLNHFMVLILRKSNDVSSSIGSQYLHTQTMDSREPLDFAQLAVVHTGCE